MWDQYLIYQASKNIINCIKKLLYTEINKMDGNEDQESNRTSNYILILPHERQEVKVVVYQVLYLKSNIIKRYTSISLIL